MNKISINHVKGIYEYNNNNFYSKVSIHFQITLSINEMIERDLKFGVKNYDMCYKHAHCIKAFNGNTGTVYITNPHEGGTISKVPFFEFIHYICNISF